MTKNSSKHTMKIIGVTGGVGSGKSEILHYLQTEYNCRVLMADEVARALEAPGGTIYRPLIELLEQYPVPEGRDSTLRPAPVTLPDGRINNPEMARRIFSRPELLEKVNQLVHPAVKTFILEETERERDAGNIDFFVVEAALLIEGGYGREVDSMWYIYCDAAERRRRLKASRGYSDEKVDSIMENQRGEAFYRENSDVVIDNSGALEESCRQVDEALRGLGYGQTDGEFPTA
ncbi:MAG: dephospho-CoA kinase [Eubacteriales bacterium]|nr:dephospho-CoA kinase [Eubacteriales bacterium]